MSGGAELLLCRRTRGSSVSPPDVRGEAARRGRGVRGERSAVPGQQVVAGRTVSPPPLQPHAPASGSLWLPRPEARSLYMCHETLVAPWRRARAIGCVSLRVTGESRQ